MAWTFASLETRLTQLCNNGVLQWNIINRNFLKLRYQEYSKGSPQQESAEKENQAV